MMNIDELRRHAALEPNPVIRAVYLADLRKLEMTLYARLEPTTDAEGKNSPAVAAKKDVVLYDDREATKPVGRYRWDMTKPKKSDKRVTHNTANYDLEWLPDL
jgi:hypothetical protein